MINILVIDDIGDNMVLIKKALKEKAKFHDNNLFPRNNEIDDVEERINMATSRDGAGFSKFLDWLIEYITSNEIDLLILDLALSSKEEAGNTQATSGIKIINHLVPDIENNRVKVSQMNFLPIVVLSGMGIKIANSNIEEYGKNEDDESIVDIETGANIVLHIPVTFSEKAKKFGNDLTKNKNQLIKIIKTEGEKYKWLKNNSHTFESSSYDYDLAIICALEKEFRYIENLELDEELNPTGTWEPVEDESSEKTYLSAFFKPIKGNPIKVIAVCNKAMGMPEASSITTRVIEKYRPMYVAMTGMAAGLDENSGKLGDIMIPEAVWNWQQGKFKAKARGTDSIVGLIKQFEDILEETTIDTIKETLSKDSGIKNEDNVNISYDSIFDTETRHLDTSKDIGNAISSLSKAKENKKDNNKSFTKDLYQNFIPIYSRISEKLPEKEKEEFRCPQVDPTSIHPAIIGGKMISGSAVVADSKIVEQIKEDGESRKVVGLDMEAYGVAYAVWNTPKKYRPKSVIIIKAICDFANEKKNDDYQEFAAYASAQTLYKLFTDYADHIDFEAK